MSELVALVAFSFMISVTPGPNNAMLWASGVKFGFRPTLPHIIGTSIGISTMAIAVAAGIGVFVTSVPEVEFTLKVIGSLYLLYLAYQIAASSAIQGAAVARPLRLGQAAAFQYVNPKAWIFVLAASAFRPPEFSVAIGSALVALTIMIVLLPTASVWAAGGTILNRFITSKRAHRALSLGLALLLATTVAYIWI